MCFFLFIDKMECVYVEVFYYFVVVRDVFVRYCLYYYVSRFRVIGDKILKCIMSSCGLRYFIVRFRFKCVN